MSFLSELAELFKRDLGRLNKQIEACNDEALWETLPGVTNSVGNLSLHVEGNLREFVGRQLGRVEYERKRDLEFSNKGLTKADLIGRIDALRLLVPAVIEALPAEEVQLQYPQVVLDAPMTTQQFLIHLYGHLNWHLGQVDYLRRISS